MRYGVTPDFTTFGKIVAEGMPGAAVAGKAEIMDMMASRGDPAWDNRRRFRMAARVSRMNSLAPRSSSPAALRLRHRHYPARG